MAKIGIITRTKNRPLLLRRALQSVVSQTLKDWQLVVVNDGGEKGPVDALLEEFSAAFKGRAQVIHNPESRGMEAASNIGLNALKSEYVMIHDDDDSLHPEFFAETVAYLDAPPHPNVKAVITGTQRIIERIEGNNVIHIRDFPYSDWIQHNSLRRMLAENYFAPIAFVFNRQACHQVGAFREDLPVLGDWDFNVRFMMQYEIGYIKRVLAYYHDREHLTDPGSDYASTVSSKAHLHAFYDNLLRNEWLRKDIASGRTGIGMISNEIRLLWDLAWDIREGGAKAKKKKGLFRIRK